MRRRATWCTGKSSRSPSRRRSTMPASRSRTSSPGPWSSTGQHLGVRHQEESAAGRGLHQRVHLQAPDASRSAGAVAWRTAPTRARPGPSTAATRCSTSGPREFRDPKVFWYAPAKQWRMVVVRALEHKVDIYGSPDLKTWTHLSEFGPTGAVGRSLGVPRPVPAGGRRQPAATSSG